MRNYVMFSSDQGYSLVNAEQEDNGTYSLDTLPSVSVTVKDDGSWSTQPPLTGRLLRDLTRWVSHGKVQGTAKVLTPHDFVSIATLTPSVRIGGTGISHIPKSILIQIAEGVLLGNSQARRVAGLGDDNLQPICGLLNIKKSEDYFRLFPCQQVTGWPTMVQARGLLKLPAKPATATPSATTTAKKAAKKSAKK
jgi:hypothetical protein